VIENEGMCPSSGDIKRLMMRVSNCLSYIEDKAKRLKEFNKDCFQWPDVIRLRNIYLLYDKQDSTLFSSEAIVIIHMQACQSINKLSYSSVTEIINGNYHFGQLPASIHNKERGEK
jgi:hypothetical protein